MGCHYPVFGEVGHFPENKVGVYHCNGGFHLTQGEEFACRPEHFGVYSLQIVREKAFQVVPEGRYPERGNVFFSLVIYDKVYFSAHSSPVQGGKGGAVQLEFVNAVGAQGVFCEKRSGGDNVDSTHGGSSYQMYSVTVAVEGVGGEVKLEFLLRGEGRLFFGSRSRCCRCGFCGFWGEGAQYRRK